MFRLGHPFFLLPVVEASIRAGFGVIFRLKVATARFWGGKSGDFRALVWWRMGISPYMSA